MVPLEILAPAGSLVALLTEKIWREGANINLLMEKPNFVYYGINNLDSQRGGGQMLRRTDTEKGVENG